MYREQEGDGLLRKVVPFGTGDSRFKETCERRPGPGFYDIGNMGSLNKARLT